MQTNIANENGQDILQNPNTVTKFSPVFQRISHRKWKRYSGKPNKGFRNFLQLTTVFARENRQDILQNPVTVTNFYQLPEKRNGRDIISFVFFCKYSCKLEKFSVYQNNIFGLS